MIDGIAVSPDGKELAVALQVNKNPNPNVLNPRGEIVVYSLTGGATQTFTLSVPDWYSGGTADAAISMAYRNAPGNAQDYHRVGVYEQSVALDSTATVAGTVTAAQSNSIPIVLDGVVASIAVSVPCTVTVAEL